MNENPYGPPPSPPPVPPPASPPIPNAAPAPVPRELTVGGVFGHGWSIFTANYGLLLGIATIHIAIEIGSFIITSILQMITMIDLISLPKAILFEAPLVAGIMFVGVKLARGHRAEVNDMFFGFTRYWPVVGVGALVTLITIAAVFVPLIVVAIFVGLLVVTAGPMAFWAAIPLGLLLIALWFAISARLWFATVFCLDPWMGGPGVIDSISITWRESGASRWLTLVGIFVLMWMIYLASAIALVLPVLFFAMPLATAIFGAVYVALLPASPPGMPVAPVLYCRTCGYDRTGAVSPVCPECGMRWAAD